MSATRSSTRGRSWWRTGLLGLGLIALLATAAWVGRGLLLQRFAEMLVVDDTPQHAQFVVMLSGEYEQRPRKVAELVKAGYAERVLICDEESNERRRFGFFPSRTEVTREMLEAYGVPRDRIVILPSSIPVGSTIEEARTVERFLHTEGYAGPLMLVTSALHTGRARWTFQQVLRERAAPLIVVAAPHGRFDTSDWWRHEHGLVYVNNEVLKWLFYVVNYAQSGV